MSQYAELKEQLEKNLKDITEELKHIAIQEPNTKDWVAIPPAGEMGNADENVAADLTEEWAERRALTAQLETKYRNIVKALAKFTDNSYGIYEISGKAIETERLQANPAARTNIANRDRESELPI